MSLIMNQLIYLKERSSWKQIATQSGIPYRRLLRLKNIGEGFTSEEARLIRNTYQRGSYQALREQGFSARESARWSWQTPAVVDKVLLQLETKITELAMGKTIEYFDINEISIKSGKFNEHFWKVYKSIQEGIRKSPEGAEVIYDY